MNTKHITRMGRIGKTLVCALGWISAIGLAASLEAQERKITIVNYTCNIGGAPAQLTAQVEEVRPAAIWEGDGRFRGAISTGEVNYYYQGSLVSANSRYSFTGENSYADFVDLLNNERFRVRLDIQGQQLLMVINPQGPGPVQYMCQQGNSGAPQAGSVPQPGRGAAAPQQAQSAAAMLDRMMAIEREDLGVRATAQLHSGAMHGPTPNTIPGGQVVTTKGLVELIQKQAVPFLLIDVLGGNEMLPEAIPAEWAASAGSFDDKTQQRLVQMLQQETKGNKNVVLVFYCQSRDCWMSYNAALRAINAGYANVLWYRGGLEAWTVAGLPTQAPGRGQSAMAQQNRFGR